METVLEIARYLFKEYTAIHYQHIMDNRPPDRNPESPHTKELTLEEDIYVSHVEIEGRRYLERAVNDPGPSNRQGPECIYKASNEPISEIYAEYDHWGLRFVHFGPPTQELLDRQHYDDDAGVWWTGLSPVSYWVESRGEDISSLHFDSDVSIYRLIFCSQMTIEKVFPCMYVMK